MKKLEQGTFLAMLILVTALFFFLLKPFSAPFSGPVLSG